MKAIRVAFCIFFISSIMSPHILSAWDSDDVHPTLSNFAVGESVLNGTYASDILLLKGGVYDPISQPLP